jgi:hypothetical protein
MNYAPNFKEKRGFYFTAELGLIALNLKSFGLIKLLIFHS